MPDLSTLNPQQRQAVETIRGPVLILAGAGTGKTRVITFRIAELLRRGVWPDRILAVTFTNKAAGEMRERIEKLTGGRGRGMWVGTFHATCARLLRMYAEKVKLGRDFVIFDDNDQRTLVARVLKDLGIADRFATPRAMLSAIDGAKNRGEGPDVFQGHDYFSDLVARVYPVYQQRLEQSNGVDFGDLLLKVNQLCREHAGLELRMAGLEQRLEYFDASDPTWEDSIRQSARHLTDLLARHQATARNILNRTTDTRDTEREGKP